MVSEETLELYNAVHANLELRHDNSLYWRESGKKAGWEDEDGYLHIRLLGRLYLAHRLIYLYVNRELPDLIDHVDRDPSNNHILNLRASCKKANAINTGLPSNNKSGVKGVSWHKAGQKWTAQIKNDGRKIHLGSYSRLEDAVEVRLKAEEELWCDLR